MQIGNRGIDARGFAVCQCLTKSLCVAFLATDNILLDGHMRPKLSDFGISRKKVGSAMLARRFLNSPLTVIFAADSANGTLHVQNVAGKISCFR